MGVDVNFFRAAEIAAAIAALVALDESIDMARISKRYAELYEEKDLHYHSQFRQIAELSYINDVWALPVPQFDFIGQRNRTPYNPFIGPMPAGTDINNLRFANDEAELAMLQGRIYADIGNYLYAFEEERVRIEDERRWEYRSNVINIGLGLANDVRDRFSSSLEMLDVAVGNKIDAYSEFSNEMAQVAGFRRRLAQEPKRTEYRFDAPTVSRLPTEIKDISSEIASRNSLVVRRTPGNG